jgi:hypothetical protein
VARLQSGNAVGLAANPRSWPNGIDRQTGRGRIPIPAAAAGQVGGGHKKGSVQGMCVVWVVHVDLGQLGRIC